MENKIYSRVYAEIDLSNLLLNVKELTKNLTSNTKLLPVIKADAYGHGAVPIAKELEEMDSVHGYAVATVEEAMVLKRNQIKKPILLFSSLFKEQFDKIVENEFRATVFQYETAQLLSEIALKQNKTAYIHLKIDTGMSRIGFFPNASSLDEIEKISKLENLVIEGIFTHFSRSDETDKSWTYSQLDSFEQFIKQLEQRGITIPFHHSSNSAATIDLNGADHNLTRPGIALYGLWPSEEVEKQKVNIKPVLSLKSQIAFIKTIPAGTPVGYGASYVSSKEVLLATIPVGYGDGYPRSLSNKGMVLIHGLRANICGRICMDQFMVDVSHIPDVKIGDTVTIVGEDGADNIYVEELADLSGRFNYEFVCDLGKRIPRVFKKNGIITETKDYFDY